MFWQLNKLFNKNFEPTELNNHQKEVIQEVNNWKQSCKLNFSKMIIDCINDMKPSNSAGLWIWLKKSRSDRLISVLKDFMNAILCTGKIPENFNRSIIIPIIKDKSKNYSM